MIAKDKILFIGGQQNGGGYAASNKTIVIDISDSFNPKIIKESMHYQEPSLMQQFYQQEMFL